MDILIVENVKHSSTQQELEEQAKEAYGMAALNDFDIVIGLDENGECPIIQDRTHTIDRVETIMC